MIHSWWLVLSVCLLKNTKTKTSSALADRRTVSKSSPVGQRSNNPRQHTLFLISSTRCQSVSLDLVQHSQKVFWNVEPFVQNSKLFLSKTRWPSGFSRCCHQLILQPAWRVSISTFRISPYGRRPISQFDTVLKDKLTFYGVHWTDDLINWIQTNVPQDLTSLAGGDKEAREAAPDQAGF